MFRINKKIEFTQIEIIEKIKFTCKSIGCDSWNNSWKIGDHEGKIPENNELIKIHFSGVFKKDDKRYKINFKTFYLNNYHDSEKLFRTNFKNYLNKEVPGIDDLNTLEGIDVLKSFCEKSSKEVADRMEIEYILCSINNHK